VKPFYIASAVTLSLLVIGVAMARKPGISQGINLKNWRVAVADAQKSDQIMPLIQQGKQAVVQGRYAKGETLFRQALQIQPRDAMSWLLLADVCEREGRQTEALRAYHELVYSKGWGGSINSSPTTHFRYVLALLRDHQWPEAVEVYDKAMNITTTTDGHPMFDPRFDPQHPDREGLEAVAHLGLGITSQSFGPADTADQLNHLKTAVRMQPRWALAQYSYGRALERGRRFAEARTAYTNAAKLEDGQVTVKSEEAMRQLKRRGM
jgi:tetratricopeptide (TPR) repeat protein